MYTIQYQQETPLVFESARDAVKYFDSKGYSFERWTITSNHVVITLEQFFDDLDSERYNRVNEILGE